MLKARTSKRTYLILSAVCIMQAIYIYMESPATPEPSEIISVTPVDSTGAIYEVLYNSGGATVPFIYRYFLMEKINDPVEALDKIKSSHPFLVTKSPNAVRTVLPERVKLTTLDTIYKYRNTAYYKTNGELKGIKLDLTSDMP